MHRLLGQPCEQFHDRRNIGCQRRTGAAVGWVFSKGRIFLDNQGNSNILEASGLVSPKKGNN